MPECYSKSNSIAEEDLKSNSSKVSSHSSYIEQNEERKELEQHDSQSKKSSINSNEQFD